MRWLALVLLICGGCVDDVPVFAERANSTTAPSTTASFDATGIFDVVSTTASDDTGASAPDIAPSEVDADP